MGDEHIESLQSSVHFLPTRLPKIILQRVEEEFPTWKEIIVSVMWPCADKRII
jgi:type VI protein secretion system component VasA